MTHTVEIQDTMWEDARQFGHPPTVVREAVRLGLREIQERQQPRPTALPTHHNRWKTLGVTRNRALDPELCAAVDNLIERAGSESEALNYLESQKGVSSISALIMNRWGKDTA